MLLTTQQLLEKATSFVAAQQLDAELLKTITADTFSLQADYSFDKDRLDATPRAYDEKLIDRLENFQHQRAVIAARSGARFDFCVELLNLIETSCTAEEYVLLQTKYFTSSRVLTNEQCAEKLHYSKSWVKYTLTNAINNLDFSISTLEKIRELPATLEKYSSLIAAVEAEDEEEQ